MNDIVQEPVERMYRPRMPHLVQTAFFLETKAC